jgi:hypothetical protein
MEIIGDGIHTQVTGAPLRPGQYSNRKGLSSYLLPFPISSRPTVSLPFENSTPGAADVGTRAVIRMKTQIIAIAELIVGATSFTTPPLVISISSGDLQPQMYHLSWTR